MVEITTERLPATVGQRVGGAGNSPFKPLATADVPGFLQPSAVDAQVPVGGLEELPQIGKGDLVIDGQATQDRQPDTLMDETVEPGSRVIPVCQVDVFLPLSTRLASSATFRFLTAIIPRNDGPEE